MIQVLMKYGPSLLGTALERVLAFEPDMTVVGRLTWSDALEPAGGDPPPDVVVLDARKAEKVESECRALSEALPAANLLVMIPADGPAVQPDLARMAPRVGFITTDESWERFTDAIRRLAGGGAVIGPDVALAALKAKDNPLTEREREALALMLTGASTQEVADLLYLRVGTVRNYLSSAIGKTGARTRIDAIRIAQEAGWI
ncbi:response regulator transcription factor [Glycomyces xiaoerkulensis]|uniref:response regulator transcription factor n=1 Tax=Glycomyces xiaoerkulensis TaxID=2038139 RepID=UPI000C2646F6|nr:response regulator transcription factor [Glycomyces xiaoerkulensis]